MTRKVQPAADAYDCIVIGSGVGGLTAAALLALHGDKRVLVLERHTVPGGFTHTFARKGYEWDTGVHYVGRVADPSSQERALFDHVTEGRLRWQPLPEHYDRFRFGDRELALPSDAARFEEELGRQFPAQRAAIRDYVSLLRSATRAASLYFAEKVMPRLLARALGPLLRWPFLRHARTTTASQLQRLTADDMLRGVLAAQWLDYGLPPQRSSFGAHAMVAWHYLRGAAYPVGGSASIAASFLPTIERRGGQVCVRTAVERVLLDDSGRATGVALADGTELRAGAVISDVGARNTFARLLPRDARGVPEITAALEALPPSTAHVGLYVGLRCDAATEVTDGANLWWFPGPDHDANHSRYLADPSAAFPGLFLSSPSAKDPSYAARHPGRCTFELMAPAEHRWFRNWRELPWQRRGADYEEFKQQWAARMLAELERMLPAVRGRIEFSELSTPLSTQYFTGHPEGEMYGLAHGPERFESRLLTPRTPFGNLFLTGQDVATCGITGAMVGGYLTASAMLRRNLLRATR